MDEKTKELLAIRAEQDLLDKELKNLKKKIPRYRIIYLIFSVAFVLLFEKLTQPYFKESSDAILISIGFSVTLGIFILYQIHSTIRKKSNRISQINARTYHLMKLNPEKTNA